MLIGTLAALMLWLVGFAGKAAHWVRRLQANTESRRAVLSTIFVGQQLLLREGLGFNLDDLYSALQDLREAMTAHIPVTI